MLSVTEGHPPRRKRAKFLMNLSVSQGIIVALQNELYSLAIWVKGVKYEI